MGEDSAGGMFTDTVSLVSGSMMGTEISSGTGGVKMGDGNEGPT